MTNFKTETLAAIGEAGKTPDDVVYVGTKDSRLAVSLQQFEAFSDFEYDSGYGGAEIPMDLVVLFSDGSYLDRREYDGSEWWEHQTQPVFNPEESQPFKLVRDSTSAFGSFVLNRVQYVE